MIDVQLKKMILDRFKLVNNGNVDFLTIDDVIMEFLPVEPKHRTFPDRLGYNGPYRNMYGLPNLGYRNYRKVLIKAKPGKMLRGRIVVEVIYDYTTSNILVPFEDIFLKPLGDSSGRVVIDGSHYRGSTLLFEATFLKGATVSQYTKEDIIKRLLNATPYLTMSDLSNYYVNNRKTLSYNDDGYNRHVIGHDINIAGFNIKNGDKFPLVTSPTRQVIIADNRYKINIRKYFYNGNTDNLSLSLADGDVTMRGCDPNRENSMYSTMSLASDEPGEADYCNMVYEMTRESHIYAVNHKEKLIWRIDTLSLERQKIILDYLYRNHHWKWGKQNTAGNYSDVPSSHNLKNAMITITRSISYKDNIGWYTTTIKFLNNMALDTDTYYGDTVLTGVGLIIKLDERYNTGYDGLLRVYVRMKQRDLVIENYDE